MWAARVARWTGSGLTAAAFARREGVNPRTLAYWRWRLRADGHRGVPAKRTAPFVELVVPPVVRDTSGPLEIVLPAGYCVRLDEAVGADMLRTVLDVLEARG
jgi:transposase-like protein